MLTDRLPRSGGRGAALALAVIVVCSFLLRLDFGLTQQGIYWPDEIYQTIEPAHDLVYGHGLLPWEFAEGARNWVLPGLIGGVLAAARLVGIDEPAGYLGVLRGVLAAIGAATVASTYLLARVHGASRSASLAGAAAAGFAAPIVFFGHRALSEVVSALPVTLGLALGCWALRAPPPDARRRRALVLGAAALLGFAVVLRLQTGVFAAGMVVALLAGRRWRDAGLLAGGVTAWLLGLGILDQLTWGHPLWSIRQYLEYNVVSDVAAEIWGRQPASYYGERMLDTAPLMTVLLLAGAVAACRRAPALLAVVAAFFLMHVVAAHKELRFILPGLPASCALATIGLDDVARRLDRRFAAAAIAAFAAVAVASALDVPSLTTAQVKGGDDHQARSAWRDSDAVNRLLLTASTRRDLCGLRVVSTDLSFTGGYSYLNRAGPLYGPGGPPARSRFYNYVIAATPIVRTSSVVAQRDGLALMRIAPSCLPDPAYVESLGPPPPKD